MSDSDSDSSDSWRLSELGNRERGFLDAANRCNERATTIEKHGYMPPLCGLDDYDRDITNKVSPRKRSIDNV